MTAFDYGQSTVGTADDHQLMSGPVRAPAEETEDRSMKAIDVDSSMIHLMGTGR